MEIKNKKFRTALEQAGLEQYRLWKDNGYFHVYSEDEHTALALARLDSTSFYVCNFADVPLGVWINWIREFDSLCNKDKSTTSS